jgi:hypothetical protein
MTKHSLLPVMITGALLLVVLNLLIGAWSHKLPYSHKLETIRTAQAPNLLFVGNSLLDSHLDEAALVQTAQPVDFRPLNAALGASEPPEQQLLFDYSAQTHPSIRTVVVGFYDFQLTLPDHTRVGDLTGNRMVGVDRRFPVSQVVAAYSFSSLDQLELEILRQLPMAANRANVWKNVELLRRSMESMGMPQAATNSMGRVADFAALESASIDIFEAEACTYLEHPDHFNASYESIFNRAHRAGMQVVIVLMPISPYHRTTFYALPLWRRYEEALTELAQRRGIQVIDASDWLPSPEDFSDHLHMTHQAAHVFSIRLAGPLAQTQDR